MKNTMAMIIDVVAGLKDVLLSVIGLGVLVQLIFVGGFFGMDIIGNLISLVNLFATRIYLQQVDSLDLYHYW